MLGRMEMYNGPDWVLLARYQYAISVEITRTIIQRAAIVVIITSIQTMSRNRRDCSQQCLASRILEWILEQLSF